MTPLEYIFAILGILIAAGFAGMVLALAYELILEALNRRY